jgi:NAD(P)-dependent dehydrogenase (short-subunit alcohol dehydrogenase family)
MNHTGSVAIVTGASMGIGRAIACILADAGYDVVCAARSETALAQTAEDVRRRGRRALAVPTDISDPEAVARMIDRTMAELGRIDVLINNAGGPLAGASSISPASQDEFFETMSRFTFENISDRDFKTIFAVNFYGPLYCIRSVLPVMNRQGSGHIINITSKAGLLNYNVVPGMIAYASAKASLARFTEVLAFELVCSGSPVRINGLSPGMVAVSFHANLPEEEKALFRKPEDIRESLLAILDYNNPSSGELFTEELSTWIDDLRREL